MASREAAAHHFRRACKNNCCRPRGSIIETKVHIPKDIVCNICDIKFENLHMFYLHCQEHHFNKFEIESSLDQDPNQAKQVISVLLVPRSSLCAAAAATT
eukprot:7471988-Karenia_brevis.AAC.1